MMFDAGPGGHQGNPGGRDAARVPRVALEEEARFRALLQEPGEALVLFAGAGCPYSRRFEPHFLALAEAVPARAIIRLVEEGGRGAVAEQAGVDVTPTVGLFRDAEERSRLEARVLLGLSRRRFRAWLREQGLLGD